MTDTSTDVASTDVAIVGAGPVGLLLALLLGRKGWRVEVVERQPRPYDRPRAVHLDGESARILQHAGVMAGLAARVQEMDSYLFRNAGGDPLLWLDGTPGRPTASGWPASVMFHQPDLEGLLADAIETERSVVVRRGFEVVSVMANAAGGVRVGTRSPTGRARPLDARWVVGCDGAASSVRQLAKLGQTDLGHHGTWLVVDVLPTEAVPWSPLNVQVCDPARPTTAVSGGPGRRRFEWLRLPGDPAEGAALAELIWRLLAPWGLTVGNAVLERHASYTFGSAVVDAWRSGAVLVAGDAAHQMPPFAGQGLCAGLRDAANLAWKLHLVLAGKAPSSLLDTYGSERGPQVRAELDFSVELGTLLGTLDPVAAAARDDDLRALGELGPQPPPERPPPGPGIWHAGDSQAGTPSFQAPVPVAGRRVLLDDVTGGGWRLLCRADLIPRALPSDLDRWWASIGGRRYSIGEGGSFGDPDGAYRAWFDTLAAEVVLVRPDGYVYGTGTGVDAGARLAGSLRASLAAPGTA